MPDPDARPDTAVDPRVAAAIVDVFVYVVVLNLFVEYLPQVISESFTLSLLTAALLKGVLELVVLAKNWVKARFRQASTSFGKATAGLLLWVVLLLARGAVRRLLRPGRGEGDTRLTEQADGLRDEDRADVPTSIQLSRSYEST